jgi:mannosyltransferase
MLGLVVVAGAILRFATLDTQSLWYDEAVTAHLLRMDLPALLRAIPDSESSPPLYYVLAWLWTHLAGTGEVGLRSLSALFGTATIGAAWALAKRLGGARAGLAAAALVAFNPMLAWFSQEARAYALLALLGALSALLWLRALDRPRAAGRLLAWGAVAALALATHYYAAFLVAPQALWLALRAPGRRERAAALALPLAAAAALAPLALGQRANDTAAFIGDSALLTRIAQVPKQFLVGYDAPAETLLAVLTGAVLIAGLAGLARLLAGPAGTGRERAELRALAAVAAAALALPLLAALAGEDHLLTRNLLAVLPLAAALAGAGLAALGTRMAAAATAAACALGLAAIAGVASDRALQREDWRGAARALRGADSDRAVWVLPGSGATPLRYYLPHARQVTRPPANAGLEIVVMGSHDAGTRLRAALARLAGRPLDVPRQGGFAIVRRVPGTAGEIGLPPRAGAALLVVPRTRVQQS